MSEKYIYQSLDPGIKHIVKTLRDGKIETFESCEGGDGHSYPEPTVRFHGDKSEGYRALDIAMKAGLLTTSLRRIWCINDGEATGPYWEITFLLKNEKGK